ncbi:MULTISPECIES: hypothetical protein [unclassified Bradyrhizobium]|uniref:hypothetical protein n=1 Tax=unclassified Bradyrhizobium TaxID=2631580 RepID=UPI001FF9B654|nr:MULTISPECIES: hypothetical protein [unclassified Bradyrhizobium]MCK1412374.1 hypothetical protein [Bradyrhizobium sp. CW4]UPJ26535.1 hypothetical protein IVB54_33495 [Bradyrhizobium sp. CW1]
MAAGEDVWIALQLSDSVQARGSACDGRRLRIATRELPSLRLLVVDGVEDEAGVSPLNSFGVATTPADISWQMEFAIERPDSIHRLRTQFVSGLLYSELSGLPMPSGSRATDGFSGRRLP